MSRAFTKETDEPEAMPERPLSANQNFVTAQGLESLRQHQTSAEAELRAARAVENRYEIARHSRDLRYWSARVASARVITLADAPVAVRFGVTVELRLESGDEKTFQIVGEDEADPAAGLLSWVSPLATSLMGLQIGDTVRAFGGEAEIISLS
jgi:transcription elongation GreA/GreB family factor